jgi:hypothetical protein
MKGEKVERKVEDERGRGRGKEKEEQVDSPSAKICRSLCIQPEMQHSSFATACEPTTAGDTKVYPDVHHKKM